MATIAMSYRQNMAKFLEFVRENAESVNDLVNCHTVEQWLADPTTDIFADTCLAERELAKYRQAFNVQVRGIE